MRTDVPERRRPEQCVDDRVDKDVTVRMRLKAGRVGNANAAEHQRLGGVREYVRIVSETDAHGRQIRPSFVSVWRIVSRFFSVVSHSGRRKTRSSRPMSHIASFTITGFVSMKRSWKSGYNFAWT